MGSSTMGRRPSSDRSRSPAAGRVARTERDPPARPPRGHHALAELPGAAPPSATDLRQGGAVAAWGRRFHRGIRPLALDRGERHGPLALGAHGARPRGSTHTPWASPRALAAVRGRAGLDPMGQALRGPLGTRGGRGSRQGVRCSGYRDGAALDARQERNERRSTDMKSRDRIIVKYYSDATKTEDGVAFPKADYTYTPSDEPSTWKIRLWETPDKKETPRQVGMAIAAMGKGFRGNKAQIPDADRAWVMPKIRSPYKKANSKDMPAEMMHALLDGEDVQGYLFDYEQLSGVELFATGEHNGDKYTEKDLDDMVEAFNALDFQPALKSGHTDAPGTPALGYISALRRVGEKLVADLIDVPSEVYKQIRGKKFNRLSAEIYWNL